MKKTLITTSLIAALMAMPAMATQDEIDQKTVTSKYYVDQELATKQDTISINNVLFYENKDPSRNVYVPALVATNAAGTALNGNTVGVMDFGSMEESGYGKDLSFNVYNTSAMDSFVPTVRAVAGTLGDMSSNIETKQDKMSCAGYVPGHENDINYCWLYGDVQVSCLARGNVCDGTEPCCSGLRCYAPKGSLETICYD